MYNDTIKVANKIITYDNLIAIFQKMNEKYEYYMKINQKEEQENEAIDYKYQKWSFKNSASRFKFDVNFYDDTRITFDNYNNFIGIFNNRLPEIKDIYVCFSLSYSIVDGLKSDYYTQSINLYIYEDKMNCDISLNSSDNKIDDVYQLIKDITLKAPPKYNTTISKRSSIINKICFGYGLIPAIVIMALLCLIEPVREAFKTYYVIFPLGCLGLGYLLGNMLIVGKVNDLYSSLIPEKKYAGYVNDSYGYRSVYKDDVEKFTETSEILIGKNADNMKKRKAIRRMEAKYKNYLLPEIAIIIIISLILILL